MDNLYLLLDLAVLTIPLLLSFHPKIKFYSRWKFFFPGVFIMSVFFISWDMIFTAHGIWGFNGEKVLGWYWGGLPVEEWLFFLCIPYAGVFFFYLFKNHVPKYKFSDLTTLYFYVIFQFITCGIILYNYDVLYPLIACLYSLIIFALAYNFNRKILNIFFPFSLLLLLLLVVTEGLLTGLFTENPVIWYDTNKSLGVNIGTIPIENVFYWFSMLLTVILLMEKFESKRNLKSKLS